MSENENPFVVFYAVVFVIMFVVLMIHHRRIHHEASTSKRSMQTSRDPVLCNRGYVVDPPVVGPRLETSTCDYAEAVASAWRIHNPQERYDEEDYMDGLRVVWDCGRQDQDRRPRIVDTTVPFPFNDGSMLDRHLRDLVESSRIMSSSLLLYRLCCLWPVHVNTHLDRYKCVWEVRLWHVDSGLPLCFDEHKGACRVMPMLPRGKTVDDFPTYRSDVLELVELLYGDCCPHTYDGVLAGSIA